MLRITLPNDGAKIKQIYNMLDFIHPSPYHISCVLSFSLSFALSITFIELYSYNRDCV